MDTGSGVQPHYVVWTPKIYTPTNERVYFAFDFDQALPCHFNFELNSDHPHSRALEIDYQNGSSQAVRKTTANSSPGVESFQINNLFERELCPASGQHVANVSDEMSNNMNTMVKVYAYQSQFVHLICGLIGWTYFLAWSVSFYPQIILNYRRRSTHGLNVDFVLLNVVGFACYALYNVLLYFYPVALTSYYEKYPDNLAPVELNDVAFAVHALILCLITMFQVWFYDKTLSRVHISKATVVFISMSAAYVLLSIFYQHGSLIDVLEAASLVKVGVTLVKYIPQAYQNFHRQSTVGWSIYNILLDFTGGSLSILQMALEAWNYNIWTNSNPVKLALGGISIMFDCIFILQHYVLYRHNNGDQRNGMAMTNGEHEDTRRLINV